MNAECSKYTLRVARNLFPWSFGLMAITFITVSTTGKMLGMSLLQIR